MPPVINPRKPDLWAMSPLEGVHIGTWTTNNPQRQDAAFFPARTENIGYNQAVELVEDGGYGLLAWAEDGDNFAFVTAIDGAITLEVEKDRFTIDNVCDYFRTRPEYNDKRLQEALHAPPENPWSRRFPMRPKFMITYVDELNLPRDNIVHWTHTGGISILNFGDAILYMLAILRDDRQLRKQVAKRVERRRLSGYI